MGKSIAKGDLIPRLLQALAFTLGLVFTLGLMPVLEPPAKAWARTLGSWVSAPGRVEPVSEEIDVGASMDGKLKAVLVEEGERVKAGQIIAFLENDDYRAAVAQAEARLRAAEAVLSRLEHGSRSEERLSAQARVQEAKAVLHNAERILKRRKSLYKEGFIPREQLDQAAADYEIARARYRSAVQEEALVRDETRPEDLAKARADVKLSRAELDRARAVYEKTLVRAPIGGVILRKLLHAGEAFSLFRGVAIVKMGDLSTRRVRVEVDENDVGKIRVGQTAYVTAPAFGSKQFWGKVVRISPLFGKKQIRTEEPTERVDTKVLETFVKLGDGRALPAGMRVDAFILVR